MIKLTHPEHGEKEFFDGNGLSECLADGWTIAEAKKPRKKRTVKVKHDKSGTDNESPTGTEDN